ncbi:hypothetical protein TD95_005010 [Thielaviopsis punctulata]|uniref:RanBD1 domain-containing protein n=1 Tax=Thielaviopsis punctulata TaxID=72032 RepID=A0A0F4ZGG6_9PEZI|nr:hypothetical protein TD95_005010 [Thielaviopsis punctulata]
MIPAPVDSPVSDRVDPAPAPEDATTTAARKELSNTKISESDREKPSTPTTPGSDSLMTEVKADGLHEKLGSPKKKRAHDEIGDGLDKVDTAQESGETSEPEKKRAKDEDNQTTSDKSASSIKPADEKPPVTSASAFAKSGFAARASSTVSPFGSASAASGTSIFGGGGSGASSGTSPFGSSSSTSCAAPKLSFGSTAGSSPFGSLGGASSAAVAKPFGSAIGSASVFGGGSTGFGGIGGSKLSSFAKPGDNSPFVTKSAKPFGAPDSDVEDDSDDDDSKSNEDDGSEEKKEEKEDKEKKIKLHKIEVNDGESGEATILSVRSRLYHLDKDMGWKERGAGNAKINVPEASVSFDNSANVVAGSFDASMLQKMEASGSGFRGVRIIMRQDHTGRVILNTVLVPAMKFQLKEGLKSTGITFTAFEDGKPVNVHLKMTAANAKAWMSEVEVVQRDATRKTTPSLTKPINETDHVPTKPHEPSLSPSSVLSDNKETHFQTNQHILKTTTTTSATTMSKQSEVSEKISSAGVKMEGGDDCGETVANPDDTTSCSSEDDSSDEDSEDLEEETLLAVAEEKQEETLHNADAPQDSADSDTSETSSSTGSPSALSSPAAVAANARNSPALSTGAFQDLSSDATAEADDKNTSPGISAGQSCPQVPSPSEHTSESASSPLSGPRSSEFKSPSTSAVATAM